MISLHGRNIMQEAFTVALIEPNECIGQAIISELERLQFVKKVLVYNRFDVSDNCFLFRGTPVSNAPLDTITDDQIKLLIYCADDNSYPFYRSRIDFDHQWLIDASGGSFDPQMLFFDQMDLESIKEVKLPHPIAYQYTLILDVFNVLYNLKSANLFTACAVSTGGQLAMNELIMQTKAILNHEEIEYDVFPKQIALNCLPQIYSSSHISNAKLKETILEQIKFYFSNINFKLDLTMVQVPVLRGHTMVSHIETEQPIVLKTVKEYFMDHASTEIVASPNPAQHCIFKNKIHIGEITHNLQDETSISMISMADEFGFGIGAPLRALLIRKYQKVMNTN